MIESHEYPVVHIPAEEGWSENFAAEFVWPESGVAVFYSAGRWYADPCLWREVLIIAFPDGRLGYHRGYGRNSGPRLVGGLTRYEILVPLQRARLSFDGPLMRSTLDDLTTQGATSGSGGRCLVDLQFDAAAPMWNMKGDSVAAATMAGSMHVDQIGTGSGVIEFDGMTLTLSGGYVIRDHSRGVRNLSRYGGHNYLNGIFPSGRGFYAYAMLAPDRSLAMANAAMCEGDRICHAELEETEFLKDPDGWGSQHVLVLRSELGRMTVRFTDVIKTIPVGILKPNDVCAGRPARDLAGMCFDEPMFLEWEGQRGVGWSERGYSDSGAA